MTEPTVNLPDAEPLPGPARSWAPGEAAPRVESGGAYSGALDQKAAEVTGKLATVQREKVEATDTVLAGLDSVVQRLMPRIEQLSQDAGVEAGNLKPWDADVEAAKRRTDPIEAFGSFGSAFGIIASAFTHAPMMNALNASAAAMEAIKANDEKSYERGYKAWQDNAKMALERHKIQHDAYQDAVSLLSTNVQLANTKLQVLATRFGDKQVQTLLEAGMSKEVIDLLAARQRMALELEQNLPKIVLENARMSRLFALGFDTKNPQSEQSQKALRQFQIEQAELKRAEHGWGAAANLTTDRQRAQDVAAYRQQLQAETNPDGSQKYTAAEIAQKAAEFEKKLKSTAAAPTGNRIDELQGKVNQVEYAETTIDKVEELLKKHKAITGLGGTITRPAEVVSNIFGGNETDRRQFERYILELQEWAPRILTGSNGRPLSAEAAKVAGIIAGLRPGDTTANTARAYVELKSLLARIKEDLRKRKGEVQSEGTTAPKPKAKDAPWLNDPVAQ